MEEKFIEFDSNFQSPNRIREARQCLDEVEAFYQLLMQDPFLLMCRKFF